MTEYNNPNIGYPGEVVVNSPYYDSKTLVAGNIIEFGQPIFMLDVSNKTKAYTLDGTPQDITHFLRFVGIAERDARRNRYEIGDEVSVVTSGLVGVAAGPTDYGVIIIWDDAYVNHLGEITNDAITATYQNLRIGRFRSYINAPNGTIDDLAVLDLNL